MMFENLLEVSIDMLDIVEIVDIIISFKNN